MQNWNKYPRTLLLLTMLIGLCAGLFMPRLSRVEAAPLGQVATSVVISEFRTRGPVGEMDEFIELYNPTLYPIIIGGWKIYISNNAGEGNALPQVIIPSGVVLHSGQYYLITNVQYSDTVTANLQYDTDIADDGGIALTRSDDTIIDQVGMSSGSAYKEPIDGSGILPPMTEEDGIAERSYERRLGGVWDSCQDFNVNSADFALITGANPQNMSSPLSLCGIALPTLTPTSIIPPSTPGLRSILINEVGWAGTSSTRLSDQWIELHNTMSTEINLDRWKIIISDGNSESTIVIFDANDKIGPDKFFLLARSSNMFTHPSLDVAVDKVFLVDLPTTGPIFLRLEDEHGAPIDTANFGKGSGWYAGAGAPNYASMERRGKVPDGANAWFTFGGTPFARNRDGILVRGSPKQPNWAINVTPTPTQTGIAPTPTRTPTISVPPRPVINEILVRPGYDWNQDGKVDVRDEFIEIKNMSAASFSLRGWRLDTVNEPGQRFFLPDVTLAPGQRIAFYGSQTNLLLSDGGDTVRLLSSNGQVYDAYTYSFARSADRSICRLPDVMSTFGTWFEDCVPTPNLPNTNEGTVPSMPGGGPQTAVCDLADTVPAAVYFAECHGYGANIWNSTYWDLLGWQGAKYIKQNTTKFEAVIE
jgi:hypothetical protein